MNMRNAFAAMAIASALGACATTPSEPDAAGTASPGSTGRQVTEATSTGVGGSTPGGQSIGDAGRASGASGDSEHPDLKRSVYYEFDRYDVRTEYRPLVESHARWLRANPQARLTIEGNTDERGSREYNVALGQRRAESVWALMLLHGVKPGQIEAVSFGKEKPRATGHGEAARAQNRRSDFSQR